MGICNLVRARTASLRRVTTTSPGRASRSKKAAASLSSGVISSRFADDDLAKYWMVAAEVTTAITAVMSARAVQPNLSHHFARAITAKTVATYLLPTMNQIALL